MTEPALLSQWAVCGIAAAAARFVPVPLLDDVIRERAVRVAVVRTLRAHGRAWPSTPLEPLWGQVEGRGGGRLRRRLRSLPRRLLLFPVRKYTAVFGAVRGVPNDVMRVVLLARSLERLLERGELVTPEALPDRARTLRRAVDRAIDGMDLRLLTAGLADGLSQGRGLTTAAVEFARKRVGQDDPEATVDPDGALAEGAERVTEVLRRPEVAQLLQRFDAQVDAGLGRPA